MCRHSNAELLAAELQSVRVGDWKLQRLVCNSDTGNVVPYVADQR